MTYNGRNDSSLTTLVVKASILCHRATHLTGQWAPSKCLHQNNNPSLIHWHLDMPKRESDAFTASFHSINKLIDEFRLWIPQLSQSGSNTANTRMLLLVHSLTNAATIKLHGIFSYADPISNQKCVQAACDMVNFNGIDLRSLGVVNSVYGVCNSFYTHQCLSLLFQRFFGRWLAKSSLTRSRGGKPHRLRGQHPSARRA